MGFEYTLKLRRISVSSLRLHCLSTILPNQTAVLKTNELENNHMQKLSEAAIVNKANEV